VKLLAKKENDAHLIEQEKENKNCGATGSTGTPRGSKSGIASAGE